MNTSPTFWFSTLAIVLSIVLSSLVVYCLLRLDTITKAMVYRTDENKARIGRLIRELNIIHTEKRKIDQQQTEKISDARSQMDDILQEHKAMKMSDDEY